MLDAISIKLKNFYHFLFESAADNHLRIQKFNQNPNGEYEVTFRFTSYTELKRYQKKMRRLTVSLSTAVALVIVAFFVAPYVLNPNRSSASNFQWIQSNWGGSVNSNPADKTTETDYSSKDSNVVATAGGVSLNLPSPASAGDSSYAGATGFYRSDTNGVYLASGTSLTLKKPNGASCTNVSECVNGGCVSNLCITPPCAGNTSIVYNGDTYALIEIGTQCWFAENLRTLKKSDGVTNISSYCNLGGCGSPWGRLYTWDVAMNGASAATAVGYKAQGICPVGWHIPSDYNGLSNDDFGVLSTFLGVTVGGRLKKTGFTYWESPNTGATDDVGFGAVGNGRLIGGSYDYFTQRSIFMTSSQSTLTTYWIRYIFYNGTSTAREDYLFNKSTTATSVRCIKN